MAWRWRMLVLSCGVAAWHWHSHATLTANHSAPHPSPYSTATVTATRTSPHHTPHLTSQHPHTPPPPPPAQAFAMHALRIPPTREGTPLRSLLILALFTLCMRPMPLRRDGRPSRAMAGTWPAQVALGVLWMVASHGLDLP